MFYGRGAGELPTASAVMGDIIDVARNIQFYCNGRIHCTCYKNLPIKKITEIESKYFMRLLVDDKPGVLAQIASTLGKNNVSIAQVIQKNKIEDQAELVVITDLVLEQNFADALVEIKGMDHTREISTVISSILNSDLIGFRICDKKSTVGQLHNLKFFYLTTTSSKSYISFYKKKSHNRSLHHSCLHTLLHTSVDRSV